MPVSYYSSGMYVRLGFAIAAHLEPDVLLIDEVLAVGDIGFRTKCFNSINEIMQKTAVIFVSHSIPHVSRLCSDIIVLNRGKTQFQGKEVAKGIDTFYSSFKDEKTMIIGGSKAKVIEVVLESNGVKGIKNITYLDDLIIHIRVIVEPTIKYPNIIVNFFNQERQIIQQCSSYFNNVEIYNIGNEISATLNVNKINLNPGIYFLEVGITADNYSEILVRHQAIKKIQVVGRHVGYSPILVSGEWILN
jgi:lipopolysaccharide transport system ATP-binding protein